MPRTFFRFCVVSSGDHLGLSLLKFNLFQRVAQ